MNLQLIRKIAGGVALLCASFVFASQALAAVPLARVIVAKSGGNYTTITAALNAIAPTADKPYLIEVWPGVYTEPNTINMKSYVHIKGSGRDVTTVKISALPYVGSAYSSTAFAVDGKTNVAISGLTITGSVCGVCVPNNPTVKTSLTISDNTVSNGSAGISLNSGVSSALVSGNNLVGNYWDGIDLSNIPSLATITIADNYIARNGHGHSNSSTGIYMDDSMAGAKISINGNVITGNNGFGIEIFYDDSNPTISNNVITDNTMAGVNFEYDNAWGTLINNRIVNNGGALFPDVLFDVGSGPIHNPNVSFNVFDDIAGDRGVGSYNVNSNGDPILVP